MAAYKEGDTSKAICSDCKMLVGTTFQKRDVKFDDGSGTAEGVLVGVCDQCDAIVSIPAQSEPDVLRALLKSRGA